MHLISLTDNLTASAISWADYHNGMTEDERIQRHLEICQRVYERLVAEGKWPWPDPTGTPMLDHQRKVNREGQSEHR